MLPAFLTTIFFSLSVIFAARSARMLGGTTANLGRMVVAAVVLGLWAFVFGRGVGGPALPWFFLSGVIGFGFGDIALFLALARIGPRLTILLAQCLAAPFGALVERVWLGTTLSGMQVLWGLVILAGVAVALAPERHLTVSRRTLIAGSFFGVCAALGQALGAVISRKGYQVSFDAAFAIDGGTAAFQRMIGGILITGLFFVAVKISARARRTGDVPKVAWVWVVLNGLTGPALGVGCYQWALANAPSGVVLPIVATTPVVTIPLAFLIDGDRPSLRAVIGGVIAVAGCVALASA